MAAIGRPIGGFGEPQVQFAVALGCDIRHAPRLVYSRGLALSDPAALDEGFFDVQACNDSNRADIGVFANESQAVLICRLDNLGKGASGAAVQSMNVHLGVDEGLGL